MDGKVCGLPRELQSQYVRGKISCRRLEWEGGAVSSRVALLLRSAEAQPYLPRFVWRCPNFFLKGCGVRSKLGRRKRKSIHFLFREGSAKKKKWRECFSKKGRQAGRHASRVESSEFPKAYIPLGDLVRNFGWRRGGRGRRYRRGKLEIYIFFEEKARVGK